MSNGFTVSVSAVGPAKLGMLRAECAEQVDGETYSAIRLRNGSVRVLATNAWGEVRYPMMTAQNQGVWMALTGALNQAGK